jgi:adenylate cyclase
VQGKLEQAAAQWERAAELKPDDYQSAFLPAQVYRSLGRLKDQEKTIRRGMERAERELARNPENARAAYLLANALAFLGEFAKGKEWAARALAIDPDDFQTRYNVACFYSLCGEFDRAFDLLEAFLPRANAEMKAWILNDSALDPLHGLPRWQEILELAE